MARWLIAPPESSVGRRKLRAWGGSVQARSDSPSPRRADYLMCTVLVGRTRNHMATEWGCRSSRRVLGTGTAQPSHEHSVGIAYRSDAVLL